MGDDAVRRTIVLIEGIPGSGKSTFARFLANQFERNGYGCRLLLETTYEHPIMELTSYEHYTMFLEAFEARWASFLQAPAHEEVVVMESSFLQSPIVHLLHLDVDRDVIRSLIVRVSELLRAEDCRLIYFYQQDAPAAIDRMLAIRGRDFLDRKHEEYKEMPYFAKREEMGPDSHIAFFLDYAALANDIVPRVSIPHVMIENSAGAYDRYREQVMGLYGLKLYPDPELDDAVLERYVGTYTNAEMQLTLTIERKEGHLWIFGDRKLKPLDERRFYLDDMSVRVQFETDGGRSGGMVITEKDLYANRSDEGTAFVRSG